MFGPHPCAKAAMETEQNEVPPTLVAAVYAMASGVVHENETEQRQWAEAQQAHTEGDAA